MITSSIVEILISINVLIGVLPDVTISNPAGSGSGFGETNFGITEQYT